MTQLSISEHPETLAKSAFSPNGKMISHEQWCKYECARLLAKGVEAEIRTDKDGLMSVWIPATMLEGMETI